MRQSFCVAVAVVLLFTFGFSQSSAVTGSIGGGVVDARGGVVPGAKISVRNAELNTERTATTAADGSFLFSSLNPGNYTIHVSAQGMELKRPPRITLGVGSSVRLTLKLAVAGATSSVTVSGAGRTSEGNTLTPEVNKQESEGTNTIAGLNGTYLPDHVRDVSHFGDLAAGVTPENPNGNIPVIAGQRANSVNAAVDGASLRDPLNGGLRGSLDQSLFLPQTVVKEFQIVRSGASADVGYTNAGFLNLATKSGSNKLHGEAFYIGRPDFLTSNDAFGHSLDNAQNEFGGSFGGPIRKNKAFYYLGVEKDFLNTPYWTQFAPQAPGVLVPAVLLAEQRQVEGRSSPLALFARGDFNLSTAHTLNLVIDYNHIHSTNLGEGSTRSIGTRSTAVDLNGNSTWIRANLASVLNTATMNQLAAQWSDDHRDFQTETNAPTIVINGFGNLGSSGAHPFNFTSEQRRVSDDLSFTRKSHSLHVGGDFAHNPGKYQRVENLNGRFDYDSLADYLAGNVRRYQQTFETGDARYDAAMREAALYVTDRWSATGRITINTGLRWQGQWNPRRGSIGVRNDLSQWQPRIGVAYNPSSSMVVRLSAGIYTAATPAANYARAFIDDGVNTVTADSYYDPQILALVAGGSPLATVPALTTPRALVESVGSDFRNPRSGQLAATIEQQFTARLSLSAGFVHGSTWRLPRLVNVNLTEESNGSGNPSFAPTRPDLSFGRLLELQSNGHSDYNGFLTTLNWQFGRRSNLTANYTLSRSRDDAPYYGPFGLIATLSPFDAGFDRGYSDFDARHTFNLGSVFNLPMGFKVNPLIVAHSGTPFTPTIGFDQQNDGTDTNDRALSNGVIAQRNSFRQPAFFNLDVRFVKDFTLKGEGHHLDLFMDVLNMAGRANRNFGQFPFSIYGTGVSPVFSAGQPLFAPDTSHYGGARQIQFTARLVAF